jgi:hypothetical protein
LNYNLRAELARRNYLDFVKYVKDDYQANWHHVLLCEYLQKFVSGEIKRLMVFMPPQHGKFLRGDTPVFTTNGFVNHSDLQVGDLVFNDKGEQVKVIANTGSYRWNCNEVMFAGKEKIYAANEHLWKLKVEYDDHKGRRSAILETQNIFSKKNRRSPYIDVNLPLKNEAKILPIDPYILGAWLGDGHSRQGVLMVGMEDIKHFSELGDVREVKKGIFRVLIKGMTTKLRQNNLLLNKHIPNIYLQASIDQRMELLRGLMDTDGCVDFRGRCEFSQKSNTLVTDVYVLLRTLGVKPTINEYDAFIDKKNVGKKKRILFSPKKGICVFRLERKKKKLSGKKLLDRDDSLKFFMSKITKKEDVIGNCIQVEGGIYLAGRELIPTHNSELVSRNLPAYILGKNPKAKIVVASYSSDLSSTFNRDCQRIIESNEYHDIFPETTLNKSAVVSQTGWLRNSDIFQTVGFGGFFKAVGVGGALTGTAADFAIIDDPVKDSIEAMSATYQYRNWNWYNDVLYTRIHNDTGILITQTRWDINDLSGLLLKQKEAGIGENWTVLLLPAIKVDNKNSEDPRQIGDALWPERHSLEKLAMVRSQSIRTFQSLYQQNPQPTMAGGEFYKCFNIALIVKTLKYNKDLPIHLTFDFNVNPYMTCCIWQVEGKKARQIAEVCTESPRNTTKAICNEIKRLYQGHESGCFVYGDPSGNKQDTRTEKGSNDYTIIRTELAIFKPSLRVQGKAPAVVMRANFINTVFENGYDGLTIEIDSKCTNTINDYLYLKEDSDGTKKKEHAKDVGTGVTYEKYGHTSDANDYFICAAFSTEYQNYQRGGKSSMPVIGKNVSKNMY